jgi:sensor histidine kinase YesM
MKDGADTVRTQGFGLSNTAQRLQQLYGARYRFEMRNKSETEGGGLEVVIEIPSRFDR